MVHALRRDDLESADHLRRDEHGELERRHVGHAGRGGEVHVALFLRRRRVREHMFAESVSRGHEF